MTINRKLLFAFAGLLSLAACKKEEAYNKKTDADNLAAVFLQQATSFPQELTTFPFTDEARTFKFNAGFGAVGYSSKDITIKLEIDAAAFDSVNRARVADGLPQYLAFPANSYSIDKMETVIRSGELTSGTITMNYFSKKFDPLLNYLLPVSIKEASGYTINPKLKTVFIIVSKLQGKAATTAVKSTWDITASSEELVGEGAVNGRARATIDGDVNTFWHSNWASTAPLFPHWLSIDMKQLNFIDKIALHPRNNNNNGFTRFKLEGSVDGTNWILFGDNIAFDPTNRTFQEYPVTPTELRYIKITALQAASPTNTSTHLGEINVFKY
ncbi:MAG: DUF1735 domain-containing protein [Chitinophagaceae bacterium]|nr:DUF1735 domain-containing protein [Chitinophagaceae bacterium]